MMCDERYYFLKLMQEKMKGARSKGLGAYPCGAREDQGAKKQGSRSKELKKRCLSTIRHDRHILGFPSARE
jgi:hypothetical protein